MPQPLFATPPATPPEETIAFPSFNQPIKALQKLNPSIGAQLFVRHADIGKVLGYGLLYGPDERHKKIPARYVLSTALCTVAEKKGIKSHCLRKPGRGERWGSTDFLQ